MFAQSGLLRIQLHNIKLILKSMVKSLIHNQAMESLPIELLPLIASHGPDVYRGLLGYKFFTNSLTFNKQLDFKILFGYSVKITKDSIKWFRNGQYHRDDGPAVEYANGDKMWYRNGKLHRDDGPAIEYANGTKVWHRNGLFHRDDGPAIEYANEYKAWYRNGQRYHRDDGPAVEYADGYKAW